MAEPQKGGSEDHKMSDTQKRQKVSEEEPYEMRPDGCAHALLFFFLVAANHSLSPERRFLRCPWLIFHLRLQPVSGQRACSCESSQRLQIFCKWNHTSIIKEFRTVWALGCILGKPGQVIH